MKAAPQGYEATGADKQDAAMVPANQSKGTPAVAAPEPTTVAPVFAAEDSSRNESSGALPLRATFEEWWSTLALNTLAINWPSQKLMALQAWNAASHAAALEREEQAELHRMQLVAISTLALCNTRETAATHRIDRDNPYWTVALADVYAAVDREITGRERAEQAERSYCELLYAVGNKYPGETRHETALRYIRNAERGSDTTGQEQQHVQSGKKP